MQQYLDIAEIRDGVVVLRDGSFRAVLAATAVNFDLKSDKEQEAIIYAFQQFLNSLDFPIQILISSRRFNIDPYLKMLVEKRKTEHNELLKNQIDDYVEFVSELVDISNIMSKNFYVIVPFYPIESKKTGILDKLSATINPNKAIYEKREHFQTYKNQLFQRIDQIKEALSGTGVRMALLNTQELIELYYNFYNPSGYENVDVADINDMEVV